MGTLLWSPTYANGAKQALVRSYLKGTVVVWQPGTTIISGGNPLVLEEHVFGGYRLVIKFKSNWFFWNSNTYTPDFVLEDFYALAPGSSTPISAGGVLVGLGFDALHPSYHFAFILGAAPDPIWTTYPAAPSAYWMPPLP